MATAKNISDGTRGRGLVSISFWTIDEQFPLVYPHPCTGAFTQACVWVCGCVCVCRYSEIIMYGMKDGSRGQLLYISGAGVLPQLSGTVDGAVAAAAAAGSSDVDYVFRVFMISPGFSGQLG